MQTMLSRLTQVKGSVSLSVRLGWGVGALGVALLFNTYSTILLYYLTRVAGVAVFTAGTLMMIAKAYDLVTDLPMGIISDRTKSRFGRRRPWLLVGAFVCGGAFVLLFSTPAEWTGYKQAAYVLAGLVVFNTGYTLFNVPHVAMPAEMSDNYDERTAIMSFRAVAIMLGTFTVIGIAPRLAEQFGGGNEGYVVVGWMLGSLALLAMITCFFGTSGVRATEHIRPRYGLREQILTAASNVHFLRLALFKLLTLLATGMAQGSVLFFIVDILGHSQGVMLYYAIGGTLIMPLLAAPFFRVPFSRKVGKHRALLFATLGFMVVVLWWLFVQPGEPVWVLFVRALVLAFFGMGKLLLGMSLLPDVQEYDYLSTGLRREGVFAGAYNMVEKAAFMGAPMLIGLILWLLGYQSTVDNQAIEQDPSALTGIRISIAIVPAICNLLAGIILLRWNLTREMLDELRAKRDAASA